MKTRLQNKSHKNIAIKNLENWIKDKLDCNMLVRMDSDDGGNHLTAFIETTENLDTAVSSFPAKFEGWRVIFIRTHAGYIQEIL